MASVQPERSGHIDDRDLDHDPDRDADHGSRFRGLTIPNGRRPGFPFPQRLVPSSSTSPSSQAGRTLAGGTDPPATWTQLGSGLKVSRPHDPQRPASRFSLSATPRAFVIHIALLARVDVEHSCDSHTHKKGP